jgi:hypothetical protein
MIFTGVSVWENTYLAILIRVCNPYMLNLFPYLEFDFCCCCCFVWFCGGPTWFMSYGQEMHRPVIRTNLVASFIHPAINNGHSSDAERRPLICKVIPCFIIYRVGQDLQTVRHWSVNCRQRRTKRWYDVCSLSVLMSRILVGLWTSVWNGRKE